MFSRPLSRLEGSCNVDIRLKGAEVQISTILSFHCYFFVEGGQTLQSNWMEGHGWINPLGSTTDELQCFYVHNNAPEHWW